VAKSSYLYSSLTLANGVALAVSGEPATSSQADYGLSFQGGNVFSTGLPASLNRLCYEGNVQEQRLFDISDQNTVLNPAVKFMWISSPGLSPTVRFRFTDISMPCGRDSVPVLGFYPGSEALSGELSFRDCQLRGCSLNLNNPAGTPELTFALTNNIVERCHLTITRQNTQPLPRVQHYAYNNLFRGGSIAYSYNGAVSGDNVWYVENNFFDTAVQSLTGSPGGFFYASNNGFSIGTVNSIGTRNQLLNVGANYTAGPLGPYYYPTTPSGGLARLMEAGDRSAPDAWLYHYTTRNNFPAALTTCPQTSNMEEKEGATTVDIGFHYVAVDQNGNPIDTNSDDMPDYLSDLNGNGAVDQPLGEIPWDLAITHGPLDQRMGVGGQANFTVAACGFPPLTYAWTKDNDPTVRWTLSTWQFPVAVDSYGTYKVRVTDGIHCRPIEM
jgi:hypothetical protein